MLITNKDLDRLEKAFNSYQPFVLERTHKKNNEIVRINIVNANKVAARLWDAVMLIQVYHKVGCIEEFKTLESIDALIDFLNTDII